MNNHHPVSATEPDLNREAFTRWWNPGQQLLRSIRRYQKWKKRGGILGISLSKLSVFQYRFWSVISGADIPLTVQIDGGLILPHPNGIVIHPTVVIGCNCVLFQQVTITEGARLGGDVEVGAGVKIIGPVTIGNHARIGANAVVLCDVPPGATAVGVPARIIHRS